MKKYAKRGWEICSKIEQAQRELKTEYVKNQSFFIKLKSDSN